MVRGRRPSSLFQGGMIMITVALMVMAPIGLVVGGYLIALAW